MFSSVQSFSRVRLFVTPWIAARQASLSITNSQSLLKLMSIGVGDAIQLSHPVSSPSPPAPNPFQHQGLFQWFNSSHEVAKVWSFNFSISPSNEHPGLSSFRMDWLNPRDSQECSPTPQFKSINFSSLCFLHNPTVITDMHKWSLHHICLLYVGWNVLWIVSDWNSKINIY